jgi:hypothetical protein
VNDPTVFRRDCFKPNCATTLFNQRDSAGELTVFQNLLPHEILVAERLDWWFKTPAVSRALDRLVASTPVRVAAPRGLDWGLKVLGRSKASASPSKPPVEDEQAVESFFDIVKRNGLVRDSHGLE